MGPGFVGIGWRGVQTTGASRGESDGTRVVGAACLREAVSTVERKGTSKPMELFSSRVNTLLFGRKEYTAVGYN